ncbi:MAG: T9SS type A sorting domain-containing protein [bacterium]|nr:T9SS type A sorting domain-containing protein [bacterium]
MKQKWLIPIIAMFIGSPVKADVRITMEAPTTTNSPNTGVVIDSKVSGDVVTVFIQPENAKGISMYGIDVKFDTADYEVIGVENAVPIKNTDGVISIGAMNNAVSTITLRNKGMWSPIAPQGLVVRTKARENIAFAPAASFTPRPIALSLDNYPNPFNPETEIRYSIPIGGNIELTIYNMVGQTVRTLVKGIAAAGEYSVSWNATDDTGQRVAAGVYFYSITSPNGEVMKKMLLLK